MLPLELIRKDPDRVRRAAELKGESAPVDEILALDERWRGHLHRAETIKAEQNRLSKSIREAGADREARETLIAGGREVASALKELEPRERELEARLRTLWLLVPRTDAAKPCTARGATVTLPGCTETST